MFDHLNETQKKVLAVLAYYCFTYHYATDAAKENLHHSIGAANFAAAHAGIKDEILFQVRSGKIKGLQNLNRIGSVQLFETDYEFNPYA